MCGLAPPPILLFMSDTHDIQAFSDALASAVEEAGSSVVRIEGRHRGPSSSGIVWSADGAIVTADHKIEREEGIEVGLPDGRKVAARLVGRDPGTDLAVLRAEATDLKPATWVGAEGLKVGHLALALSRPGQNDAGLRRGQGIAIPAATLERVVAELLAHGGVRRGYLGVGAHPVRLPEAVAETAGHPVGLIVVAVQPGGPAEQAGVLLGDVLLSLDGHPLGDMGELHSLLGEDRAGKEVPLRLLRAGEVREIRVTLGAK